MHTEEPVTQCYEWHRGNKGVRNLTKVMNEEMETISLAFVWQNEQEYHFIGRSKPITERYNNMDRKIMATELSAKSSIVLHQDNNSG
jgi:hypothetical protein